MFIHLRHYWHKMADSLEYREVQWLDTPDLCFCDVSPTLKTLEQSIFVSTRVTVFIVKTWRSDCSDDRIDDMAVSGYTETCYTTATTRSTVLLQHLFCTTRITIQTALLRSSKWGKLISFFLCHLVSRLITDEKSRHEQLKVQMEIWYLLDRAS